MSKVSSKSSNSHNQARRSGNVSKSKAIAEKRKNVEAKKADEKSKSSEAKKDDFKGSAELNEKSKTDKAEKTEIANEAAEGKPGEAKPGEDPKANDKAESTDKADGKEKADEPTLQEQLDDLKKQLEDLKKEKEEAKAEPAGGGGDCGGGGGEQGAPPAAAPAPMAPMQQLLGANANGDMDNQLQQLALQVLAAAGGQQPQPAQMPQFGQGGQFAGVNGMQALSGNAFAQGFQMGLAGMRASNPQMGAQPAGVAPGGSLGQMLKASLVQKASQAKAQGFQPRPETRNMVAQALGQDIFGQQQGIGVGAGAGASMGGFGFSGAF